MHSLGITIRTNFGLLASKVPVKKGPYGQNVTVPNVVPGILYEVVKNTIESFSRTPESM